MEEKRSVRSSRRGEGGDTVRTMGYSVAETDHDGNGGKDLLGTADQLADSECPMAENDE